MFKSNEYVKYNPLYLCCGVVAYCREYYEIEKWPKILLKVFNVTEENFGNIYKDFFYPYTHHHTKSSIKFSYNLINKEFYSEKNKNDKIKEIKGYQPKKELIEKNKDFNDKNNQFNNINIKVNSFFWKMCNKYNKNIIKKINTSDTININLNINNANNLKNEINDENRYDKLNYELNKYKSRNSNKRLLTNIYKTPIKIGNECDSFCFYKPNKKGISYNFH